MMEFFNTETGRIIAMIMILTGTFWLSWMMKKIYYHIYKNLLAKHRSDPGRFFLFAALFRFIIIVVGVGFALSMIPGIKSKSTHLLASAGIATAIVGFAAKDVLANFVSGAVIMVFRPFTISNWININNVHEGWVEEIKFLYTVIRDKRHQRMIIPNSKIIANYIINSSYREEYVCQYVEFNVAYGTDIQKARSIIQEVAEANPHCIDHRSPAQKQENAPLVEVRLQLFGSSFITLRALVWVSDPSKASTMKWALNEEINERFQQEGIEIPFPYQNLVIKNKPDSGEMPATNI
jgi:small-conductance mechanosensitive channel